MGFVKIQDDIWELIIEHYSSISEPTADDKKVMSYIAEKVSRQMKREDFRDAQARYARMRDWTKNEV